MLPVHLIGQVPLPPRGDPVHRPGIGEPPSLVALLANTATPLTVKQINSQLIEARRRGLYTKPGHGKRGGEFTEEAKQLLATMEEEHGHGS